MFEDSERVVKALDALIVQELPRDYVLDLVVVDDGSSKATREFLSQAVDSRVRLVTLNRNQGRSRARNQGISFAQSDVVIFMDSDCVPIGRRFLLAHYETIRSGAVASFGHVLGLEDGSFWARYQRDASIRRLKQFRNGHLWAGGAGNMAVDRRAFLQVGGFDESFSRYGFEDRDLLLRLADFGEIGWSIDAVVQHTDMISAAGVCRKMFEAGCYSSRLFAAKHRKAYLESDYAQFDARVHPYLRAIGPLVSGLALRSCDALDSVLATKWLPYSLRKLTFRLAAASAFLGGTCRETLQGDL